MFSGTAGCWPEEHATQLAALMYSETFVVCAGAAAFMGVVMLGEIYEQRTIAAIMGVWVLVAFISWGIVARGLKKEARDLLREHMIDACDHELVAVRLNKDALQRIGSMNGMI